MDVRLQLLAAALALAAAPASAQQIFKCKDAKGVLSFQQVPCADEAHTEDVRRFRPVPDSAPTPAVSEAYYEPAAQAQQPQRYSQNSARLAAEPAPSGYVRCVRPGGSTYIHRGYSCPERTEVMQHQPGMILDVSTGQQHFMVPGGGNGMIDPRTGTRHELISPQPTRRVQDTAQAVSADQACAEARADRDRRLSDPNRTMNSIRAAEAKYERLCGR